MGNSNIESNKRPTDRILFEIKYKYAVICWGGKARRGRVGGT